MAIRNVVVGRVRDGVAPDRIDEALQAIVALDPPGCTSVVAGAGLGLRADGWDFAITNDFVDEDAYRAYDTDDEHNRIRRELFGPIAEQIVRIQIPA